MDSPSPAPAPDPAATAAAQSSANRATAVTQYGLNATDQVTPYGNLTYQQGTPWDDGTPHFTATTSLSPGHQSLFDLGNQTQQNIGKIGVEQSARIGERLNTPFVAGNEPTEARLMELGRKRLDPMFAQRRAATETDLINRGIRPGSEAYKTMMGSVGEQENDAYNNLLLTGRGQANTEALTERNQPINEIVALLRGSGVQQPSFTNTPTPGVAPTDVIGAQQQSLAQSNYGTGLQQQQNTALMSGLFGLGKTALGGWGMGAFG